MRQIKVFVNTVGGCDQETINVQDDASEREIEEAVKACVVGMVDYWTEELRVTVPWEDILK